MQLGKHENTRLTRGQKFFTMILALVEIRMTAYSSEPDRSPKSLMPKPLLYFQNTRYRKLQASKKDSPPIIVWHAISQHSQSQPYASFLFGNTSIPSNFVCILLLDVFTL